MKVRSKEQVHQIGTLENSIYAVKHKVMGLTAGDHVVTAHCKPKKTVEINVSIYPATLTIEE